jgi:hypothetical protein
MLATTRRSSGGRRGAGVRRILAPQQARAGGKDVNIWDVSDIQALVRTQVTSP